jgi:hypothetical protein
MGYRGKVGEQEKARELRATGMTLLEIATELGVVKSSVSLWVRDIPVRGPRRRRGGRPAGPNVLRERKLAEIERLLADGRERIGRMSEREFLVAGTALYAGEGAKGGLLFANTDPRMVHLFCAWLRRFFVIDESRMRVRLYLHVGLDLDRAMRFWSAVTGIPVTQFAKPYRATPDPSIRRNKHEFGCVGVRYTCLHTHRAVMGLVDGLLSSDAVPG